jgi:hypothetical protein
LRTLHAELRTEKVDWRGNLIFFANPGPLDVSKFTRTNEAFLVRKQKAPYTTSYFIPRSWVCSKYIGGGNWYLALGVSSNKAGFDYYHLPAKLSIFSDDDTDSELFDEALNFEVRHWSDDLEVIYDKPGTGIVRLSLAFWIELAATREWRKDDLTGYCNYATGGQGGLKLSVK